MMSLARWKIIVITMAVLFGVLFSLPNALPQSTLDKLPGFLPHQKLNLGLDLRGGSYLLMEVDTAALQRERISNLIEDVRTTLREKDIKSSDLGQVNGVVSVRIDDAGKVSTAVNELTRIAPSTGGVRDVDIRTRPDQRIEISFTTASLSAASKDAVSRSIETIRKRVDKGGTKEIAITRQGEARIVIQAPGESDPEKLKAIIGRTAKMTFQLVDTEYQNAPTGMVPVSTQVLPQPTRPDEPTVAVKRRVIVSGEDLTHAAPSYDQDGSSVVSFRFNGKGTAKFGKVTAENVGRRFAIILDNEVISAPVIQGVIAGGSGQISGNFTPESAKELADLLNSGALPAPLKVEDQRTIGPELGGAAIQAGAISLAVGAVLIFAFIILAYGLFGVFAATALVVNILMLTGFMSVSQSTLTLPGIAGLILTLAVAVDANVLIYERIRDEARAGRTPMAATDAGFRRALESILDANVTTLISAGIMLVLGQGPVRGFAVTLMVGVFTSVFTAVLITQVLISWWFKLAKPKKLPIA